MSKHFQNYKTSGMAHLVKRLEPQEGVTPKVGDKVVYEVMYDDGRIGTITTWVTEFDRMIEKTTRRKQDETTTAS